MLHRFFYKTFFVLFFVAMPSFAATADPVAESNAHITEVYPIGEYSRFLEEAKTSGVHELYVDGYSVPVVLRPDASISRIFVRRSFEDYARQCAETGVPTRLVVACGRLGHPADPMASCPGHSEAYFTVNTSATMEPDLLGDVFHMPEQAFRPRSWDFITFEGLSCFFDSYSDERLRMIANSLRPGGIWVLNFDLSHFPSVIRIGATTFKGGMSPADFHDVQLREMQKLTPMRVFCIEAGKMRGGDTAVFDSFDDVRTTVSNFFKRRGFEGAEIRNTFLVSAEKNTEDFVLVARLSGEDSPDGELFGEEINSLVGAELLPMLRRGLEELALVIRG